MPIVEYVEVVFVSITQDFLRLKHTLVAIAIKRKNNYMQERQPSWFLYRAVVTVVVSRYLTRALSYL